MKRIIPGKMTRYAAAEGVQVGAGGIHPAERSSFCFDRTTDDAYKDNIPKGIVETVRGQKMEQKPVSEEKKEETPEKKKRPHLPVPWKPREKRVYLKRRNKQI